MLCFLNNMSLQPKSKFIEQKIKESNNIIYLQDFALSLGHSRRRQTKH